ncbi:MAG: hypothetical protein ACLR02_08270 [Clostridium sp.]
MKKLKCECGGKLELEKVFDGCDWNSEHGEGSRFDYEIELICEKCGAIYALGRTRRMSDFDECKEKAY